MTDTPVTIREYFASHAPWMWAWQEEGEVVSWANGATIAFRPEITAILERLAPTGLPPFGAIVLVLAATRSSWSDDRLGQSTWQELQHRFPDNEPLLRTSFETLYRVHRLRHLLQRPGASAELAALVFEAAHNPRLFNENVQAELLQTFHDGLTSTQLTPFERPYQVLFDLAHLPDVTSSLDEETLQRRLATGLDQAIQPPIIDLPAVQSLCPARQLITDLQEDEQLGGLARLARLLLAAVQLPRPLNDPEELPIGGVTDITNHGPLDRLILSELAHDDLTLATRVAMNEALYLRREPLARPRARQRFLLIDSGLRLWGVPRVFATAVGLAVAAQASPRLQVSAWRADGDRIEPIDFRSPRGLTDHLSALDYRVHPGAALPRFAALLAEAGASCDILLVTGDDVLADPEFSQALAASHLEPVHLATVNRDGEFRLLRRSRSGLKVLSEARFDLQEVLAPRAKSAPLLDPRIEVDLPAICRRRPFPLLLSTPVSLENSNEIRFAKAEDEGQADRWEPAEVLTVTKDGRLMHWTGPKHGARQLTEGLPAGRLHWCEVSELERVATLVIGTLSQRGLYVLNYHLATGQRSLQRLELPVEQPKQVLGHHGVLLVSFHDQIAAVDPTSGRLLDWAKCDRPLVGRMFARQQSRTGADDWYAYTFDGRELRTVSVYEHLPQNPPLVAMVDRPMGPVGITAIGELVYVGTGVRCQLPVPRKWAPYQIAAVSRDRRRVALQNAHNPMHLALVDLMTGTCATVHGQSPRDAVDRGVLRSVSTRQLHVRFSGIAVDNQSRLILVSPRGTLWPLTYDAAQQVLVFPKHPPKGLSLRAMSRFVSLGFERRFGYWLAEARWPDGSRAVLDSRGMLHLQCARRGVPECSIVLVEGITAGWTSTGQYWGPAYFTGEANDRPALTIHTDILQPFVEQIT